MDITKFNTVDACEKGAWVTIKDFDGVDTDIRIKVVGIDSKRFKQEMNRLVKQSETDKNKDMEKLEASSIRTLVAITMDWEGMQMGKEDVAFSKEKADEIYTNSPHISNQVIEFAKDRTNFLD